MRIIAGARRGMKLLIPDTRETRPITDRVKESLFMILQNYELLAGARWRTSSAGSARWDWRR